MSFVIEVGSHSLVYFQNAGAVIGKGGKNIKALRTDVSIRVLYIFLVSFFYFDIPLVSLFPSCIKPLPSKGTSPFYKYHE